MTSTVLIRCGDQHTNKPHAMGLLSKNDGAGFFEWCEWPPEKELEMLVFRVSKKPNFLEAHVERIYHCIAYGLNAQLYAALLDLILVLKGRGAELCQRMLDKSKPRLSLVEFQTLTYFARQQGSDAERLTNRYALFTQGILFNRQLLKPVS